MPGILKPICRRCKGKSLCGEPCPFREIYRLSRETRIGNEVFGPSSSVFIGRSGYPDVFSASNVSLRGTERSPTELFGLGLTEIIKLRAFCVSGGFRKNVKNPPQILAEIALSARPVDVEILFRKNPRGMSFSDYLQPMGPRGQATRISLCGNPKIPRKVENSVGIKAEEAVRMLYPRFDPYYIQNLLSAGVLGERKKMVPTRWSITAVDEILSKINLSFVKHRPWFDDILVYSTEYLGNRYEIILMPGNWSLEVIESWFPGPEVVSEFEGFRGRTNYASEEGGGYYAAKFAVTEFLRKVRRQASVLVIREISEKYVLPVGVWQVRESIRQAFTKKPERFQDIREALDVIGKRIKTPMEVIKRKSRLLSQKTLGWFCVSGKIR
ncbi:MAG: hypothetical protein GXO63_00470 [Candidatus Micrarchaeota archaeon]|nr:hypothetical protein [Candidatus Micrarchaeota archaeon]